MLYTNQQHLLSVLDNNKLIQTHLLSSETDYVLFQSLLQTQALRVGQVKEPYIGLTQENSIESSVQDSLPYIPRTHGPC